MLALVTHNKNKTKIDEKSRVFRDMDSIENPQGVAPPPPPICAPSHCDRKGFLDGAHSSWHCLFAFRAWLAFLAFRAFLAFFAFWHFAGRSNSPKKCNAGKITKPGSEFPVPTERFQAWQTFFVFLTFVRLCSIIHYWKDSRRNSFETRSKNLWNLEKNHPWTLQNQSLGPPKSSPKPSKTKF